MSAIARWSTDVRIASSDASSAVEEEGSRSSSGPGEAAGLGPGGGVPERGDAARTAGARVVASGAAAGAAAANAGAGADGEGEGTDIATEWSPSAAAAERQRGRV